MDISIVGVLNDQGGTERRVTLVPDTVRRLARDHLSVVVERGAGEGAGYSDSDYVAAGARVAARPQVLDQADVILTLSAPSADDERSLRPGQVVIGMLSACRQPETVARLAGQGVIGVSLDCMPRTVSRAQAMDVLTSQASLAGYKAALVAADAFGRYFPMMITAAGTSRPASVLVLGAGVAGLSALATARRLGAVVTGYDVRPEARSEIESMGAKVLGLGQAVEGGGEGGYARALTAAEQEAERQELEGRLGAFDVIITTAAVPGARPPLLISAGALAGMRRGSIVVDMAAGPHGGNVEGSVPGSAVTTDLGVTVIGASDLPSRVPGAASDALSQNMAAVLHLLVKDHQLNLDPEDEIQRAIVFAPAPVEPKGHPDPQEESDERLAAI
ncbi:MAG: NAD(P) transhydrogenase subunit alpha [Actinomycetota bacterium]|nr:NAD(P) transhydrogenase subunit alpha [Actinomycetota bacterium]